MKFIYIDESGGRDQGDVFTMCGLMVDAYNLRTKTIDCNQELAALFQKHPRIPDNLKTIRFINGKDNWGNIDAQDRKNFLTGLCRLAVANGGKIFGIGLSFSSFDATCANGHDHPMGDSYWLASAIFISCLVQKKMQGFSNKKGHTVVIMDHNSVGMPSLSDSLYKSDPWFDGLYQSQIKQRGKTTWKLRTNSDRFDNIINTAFSIKSKHSALIQVADAISYVYRRHLELKSEEKLGRCPDKPCVKFYKKASHEEWAL